MIGSRNSFCLFFNAIVDSHLKIRLNYLLIGEQFPFLAVDPEMAAKLKFILYSNTNQSLNLCLHNKS